jgi:phage baseplate assembly protein W
MTNAGTLFGRSMAFPPRLGPDGRWAFSEADDNIRESIRIILLTEPGERLMLPTFGAGLRRFLFEPNTPTTRRLIADRIEESLRLWERRIAVESVRVDPDPADLQAVVVTITYRLVATNVGGQVTLAVNLGR